MNNDGFVSLCIYMLLCASNSQAASEVINSMIRVVGVISETKAESAGTN